MKILRFGCEKGDSMSDLTKLLQEKIKQAVEMEQSQIGVWHLLRLRDTVNEMYEQETIADAEYEEVCKGIEGGIYTLEKNLK